jgi:hypothetical protein
MGEWVWVVLNNLKIYYIQQFLKEIVSSDCCHLIDVIGIMGAN